MTSQAWRSWRREEEWAKDLSLQRPVLREDWHVDTLLRATTRDLKVVLLCNYVNRLISAPLRIMCRKYKEDLLKPQSLRASEQNEQQLLSVKGSEAAGPSVYSWERGRAPTSLHSPQAGPCEDWDQNQHWRDQLKILVRTVQTYHRVQKRKTFLSLSPPRDSHCLAFQ